MLRRRPKTELLSNQVTGYVCFKIVVIVSFIQNEKMSLLSAGPVQYYSPTDVEVVLTLGAGAEPDLAFNARSPEWLDGTRRKFNQHHVFLVPSAIVIRFRIPCFLSNCVQQPDVPTSPTGPSRSRPTRGQAYPLLPPRLANVSIAGPCSEPFCHGRRARERASRENSASVVGQNRV